MKTIYVFPKIDKLEMGDHTRYFIDYAIKDKTGIKTISKGYWDLEIAEQEINRLFKETGQKKGFILV